MKISIYLISSLKRTWTFRKHESENETTTTTLVNIKYIKCIEYFQVDHTIIKKN